MDSIARILAWFVWGSFALIVLAFVLWVPWWLSVPGGLALVAVWPAHKRWAAAEAAHKAR